MTTPYPPPQPPSAPDPYGSAYSPPQPQFTPHGYGSPYQQDEYLPASTAMATWALILAIVPCAIGFLVSIGLAITVLVRGRDGRNHGKKRAIAALVIIGLYVMAIFVVGVLGAAGVINLDEPPRDESGQVTSAKSVAEDTLRVGDCFDQAAGTSLGEDDAPIGEVTVKPCAQVHDFEFYFTFDLAGGDYPAEEAIWAEANDRCGDAVLGYSGRNPRLRQASITFVYPAKLQWKLNQRDVQCLLGFDSGPTAGTLRKQ